MLKHLQFETLNPGEKRQQIKFLDIATYRPREYFGELVLLNYDITRQNPPKRACSVFSVLNDTEVLSLNYHTFSTFFSDAMLDIMKEYAEGYPSSLEISNLFIKRTRWQQYKNALVKKLSHPESVIR